MPVRLWLGTVTEDPSRRRPQWERERRVRFGWAAHWIRRLQEMAEEANEIAASIRENIVDEGVHLSLR